MLFKGSISYPMEQMLVVTNRCQCCECRFVDGGELSSSLSFVWTDDFGFLFPFPRQMKFVVDVETLKWHDKAFDSMMFVVDVGVLYVEVSKCMDKFLYQIRVLRWWKGHMMIGTGSVVIGIVGVVASSSFVWTDEFALWLPFPRQMKFVVDVETLKWHDEALDRMMMVVVDVEVVGVQVSKWIDLVLYQIRALRRCCCWSIVVDFVVSENRKMIHWSRSIIDW